MKPDQTAALTGRTLDDQDEFDLAEFCALCAVEEHQVMELIEEGVIETGTATDWRFGGAALRRARISLRLTRHLGVNAAGCAVILDLLERIESLERQVGGNR